MGKNPPNLHLFLHLLLQVFAVILTLSVAEGERPTRTQIHHDHQDLSPTTPSLPFASAVSLHQAHKTVISTEAAHSFIVSSAAEKSVFQPSPGV
jgi:hypothetical protein